MITIKEVAKQAGVSVATVSRVLNNHRSASSRSREAVLNAIQQLGYQPNANAQALASQTNSTIGVVVTDVTDAFFAILVKAVDEVAAQYHKTILIGIGYHNAEKEREAIDTLIRKRCSCLVVHSKALDDASLAQYLQQIPGMVIINRVIPRYEQRCVSLDNQKGTFLATETLIQLGHKQIGYIGSTHKITDAQDRYQGYMNALAYYHLPFVKYAVAQGTPDFEGGEQAMIRLLSYNKDLSAVVTYNDSMAAGALSVLNENNIKVPQQFSVIGFDDMPIARYLIPKLTTIRYPIDLMANYAAKLALSLVYPELQISPPVQFNPTLVRRFSLASPLSETQA
ncbi:LacI family transcriptional regulator [Volucribacter psittacicida]|uniref:LacI family transcriptional regulator n=1 Tax=Volucribacter psittacicida TaxID=203482 RepID=A0A4R1G068_9PAST|nr:substrate-binding domain-containing protein [Volucribacter psittacicida]TCJ98328.1 LacI family transcriptional regulator [Volucribacter psittacicida]